MDAISREIEKEAVALAELNAKIHSNPELGYEEFQAHDNIVTYLKSLGFTVIPHAYGLETSMETEFGSGGRLVVFNAEYDCLPNIGHACGHNLIATASIAGFIATAAALRVSGAAGRVRLLGTPAEEGGGGKLKLLEAGAYQGVDGCLMVHPSPFAQRWRGKTGTAYGTSTANSKLYVTFIGQPAHAAFAPWQGSNALDAATLAYAAVSMLRQQTRPDERIHAVITHGGERPNVIPARTRMNFYCRAPTLARVRALRHRVEACFHAAGMATNCQIEIEEQNTYYDLRPSKPLAAAYAEAMEALGTPVDLDFKGSGGASTDQGNVSYEVPSIHPMFGIETKLGTVNHTPGFTDSAGTDEALRRALDAAGGMARTAFRFLMDDELAAKVKADFEADSIQRRKAHEKL